MENVFDFIKVKESSIMEESGYPILEIYGRNRTTEWQLLSKDNDVLQFYLSKELPEGSQISMDMKNGTVVYNSVYCYFKWDGIGIELVKK